MKAIYSKTRLASLCSLFVSLLLSMTSCSDDLAVLDKGSDVLSLTADNSEIVLNEVSHSETALTLDWTTGNNAKTGNRIYYTLEIAKAGTDFASPVYALYETTQTYQKSYTVEELNNLVRSEFNAAGDETVNLEARITAYGDGFDAQTATTAFSVTAYEPVTDVLYIIGDAAPNGWSLDGAAEMTRTDNGVFTWEGNLNQGNLKFMCTKNDWVPSYNRGASDSEMVYRATYDDPDDQWHIDESHYYKVSVNLLTKTVTFTQAEGMVPAYESLYLIGNETGWGFWAMTRDALDPFLFRIGVDFKSGGEFKFGTADGSWENNYKATYDNAPYTEQSMEFVSGYDPDHKWNLQSSELGAYKICVDIRTGQERMMMTPFTPYEGMYLIGDATSAGWDLGNAVAMTRESDFVFTWTGSLSAGELKFSCDKQSDWSGAWFLADQGNKTPTGDLEHVIFIDKSSQACKDQYLDINVGDLDQKWRISDAGTYTITLNQLEETVQIQKQ